MGDKKSLSGQSAIEKIKDLASDQICMFCTYSNGAVVSRPMGTQSVDEDGTIWFMSRDSSDVNQQIHADEKVYLMYSNTGKQHYLSLAGTAEILRDRNKVEELWNPMAKAWFEEGKDDPSLTLIRVNPEEGHYWDTKNGKLVSMLKIAAAALTGNTNNDGGVDGDLSV